MGGGFNRRGFALLLTALIIGSSPLWVRPLLPKVVTFRVLALRDGKPTPGLFYLFAFYPEGFKFLKGVEAPNGYAQVTVDLTDLFYAWSKARGRGAIPTFHVTVVTEDGDAAARVFNIDWPLLQPLSTHDLVVEWSRQPGGGRVANLAPKAVEARAGSSCPVSGPANTPTAVLASAYGQRRRVNVLKVEPGSQAAAQGGFVYLAQTYVGFSVYAAFANNPVVQLAGWNILSRSTSYNATTAAGLGEPVAISMEVDFLAQHWCYYDPKGNLVNEEVRILVSNFYPETLSSTMGEDAPPSNWLLKGTYTATDPYVPFFMEGGWVAAPGSNKFAISASGFTATILSVWAPPWLATISGLTSLVMGVDAHVAELPAFAYYFSLHGVPGTTHRVERAVVELQGADIPMIRYRSLRV